MAKLSAWLLEMDGAKWFRGEFFGENFSESIAEVRRLELIFTSCLNLSFLRKKTSWSRAKTKSKGVRRQTLSEINKGLNEKK